MTSPASPESNLEVAPPTSGVESGATTLRHRLLAVLIAGLFFFCGAAQLNRIEFSSGSELLVTATVLEIRRGGPVWVPTLRERPRLIKPPLTAWIAAAAVSDDTMRSLDSPDPAVRSAGYRRLAWEVRWPSLLATALMLLAVFESGRLLLSPRVALVGIAAAATSLLVLRFGRFATTDVMLSLFVAVATAALTHAAIRGRRWTGCGIAGLALGLAFMSKGPVAFVFVGLPFGAALLAGCWSGRVRLKEWALPLIVLAGGFVALGLPWYLDQLRVQGWGIAESWKREVLREGATELPRDPIWTYLTLLPQMLPWTVFLIAGLVLAVKQRRSMPGLFWTAAAVVLPVLVMSLFKDKNERYLLPLAGACGLVAGYAIVRAYTTALPISQRRLRDGAMAVVWVMGVGLAVFGALGGELGKSLGLTRVDGSPWHSWTLAAGTLVVLAILIAAGILLRRRWWAAEFVAASLAMALTGAVFIHGYAESLNGKAGFLPVAERLRSDYAGRAVYEFWDTPLRADHDLNIYLNRVLPGVSSPGQVSEADAVLVVVRRASAPTLESAGQVPAGWRVLETLPAGKRRAYLLGRTEATSPAFPATRP